MITLIRTLLLLTQREQAININREKHTRRSQDKDLLRIIINGYN